MSCCKMDQENTVIFLPALCGNETPRDAFWNDALTINSPTPDLTACFQTTALVWVPSALLLLGMLIYVPYLRTKHYQHEARYISALNLTKLIFCMLLVTSRVLDLVYVGLELERASVARWLAPITYILMFLLAGWLTHYEFRKGVHSSGFVFCFWLTVLLSQTCIFYSQLSRWIGQTYSELYEFVNDTFFFALICVQFCLHLFADRGALLKTQPPLDTNDPEQRPLLPENGIDGKQYYKVNELEDPRKTNECPLYWASYLSRITYSWTFGMLLTGYKRNLTGDKLWCLNKGDEARPIVKHYYMHWLNTSKNKFQVRVLKHELLADYEEDDTCVKGHSYYESVCDRHQSKSTDLATWKTNSSLSMALVKCFGPYYMLIGIFEVFNIALTFIRPILQDALISYVDSDAYVWQGYLFAISMFAVSILRALVNQQHFYGKMISGMRVRSALTGAVYRKTLLLANSTRKDYSVGEIVNLMAVDAQRVSDSTFYFHNMWSAPVNVIVAMVMLWGYLGPASLAGLGVIFLLVFVNVYLATKVKKLQVQTMKYKDQRTKLTNEILNGIKVLKLYAWEGAFQKRLLEMRDRELSYIQRTALYFSGTVISMSCAPVMFAVVSFTIYILTSGNSVLSAQVAFVSISLLSSLTRPIAFLPNGIANFVQATVSANRLEKYLNGDELDADLVDDIVTDNNALELRNATFSWDNDHNYVLKGIGMSVKRGSLTAVVGRVGCGKSSLLQAVMGELHKVNGQVSKRGSVAYVPQEAWIRNATLQKNILFGRSLCKEKYDKIIAACALGPDLDMLAGGDQTEIGEKGINLSGGQKQRVSLARAVYQERDIYLFDDPLSAVDAHVGRHIYNHILSSDGLLRTKTRVLVTHSISYLAKADQIVVMKDGTISEVGSYQELIKHNGGFAEYIKTYLEEVSKDDDEENIDEEEKQFRQELSRQISSLSQDEDADDVLRKSSVDSIASTIRRRRSTGTSIHKIKGEEKKDVSDRPEERVAAGKRLIKGEAATQGGVNFCVLTSYVLSVGYGYVVLILLSAAMNIGTDLSGNIWLSLWSGDQEAEANNQTAVEPKIRVAVYGSIGAAQVLAVAVQCIVMAVACTIAARFIHVRLLDRIVKAPMAFFDTTPLGRILNRFSQDMNVVDSAIRMTIISVLRGVSSIVTTVVAISYSSPIFLVVFIPLAICYYFVQRFYVTTSNQLRRLMSVRTSPIYSHFGETVAGASTIRAYQRQADFIADSDIYVDNMQMARYPSIVVNRWLSVWLEVLGSCVVLFACMFAVLGKGTTSAGLVGLSISYALQITDRLAFFLRNMSDLENNIVSIERINEYSSVEQEAAWETAGSKPATCWPTQGQVRFNKLSTRYRPGLDLILRSISCSIASNEKIGIVGRTGAGKSSMTLALFRIIEATQGAVIIDDIDTSTIGLHDLRSRLTIIPQDPVLFSGSIRFNLDPFEKHSDVDLWQALSHAHLKKFVIGLPSGLDYECTEGGSNISVGQRQLVCLARALLRRSKILVLDEATAAIDLETDNLIQTTIRTEFKHCTVITIAHRINTVMDYDRIFVLDSGKIVEADTPSSLLRQQGVFYELCKDAGIV